MSFPLVRRLGCGVLLLPLLFAPSGFPSEWRLRHRVHLGVEWDNNIFEVRRSPTADRALTGTLHLGGEHQDTHWLLTFGAQSGLQSYFSHPEENKLITEMEGRVERLLFRRMTLGAEGWGRLKLFLENTFDYSVGGAGLYLRVPMPFGFITRMDLKSQGLDYADFDLFDFDGRQAGVSLARNLTAALRVEATVSWHRVTFDRQAFDYRAPPGLWQALGKRQQDDLQVVEAHLQWQRGFSLSLDYSYERNRSNSYGFSYNRHRWILLAAKGLPLAMLFRGSVAFQVKSYLDPLRPFFPLELDTEREESNAVVVDLSRDLWGNLSALARAAWYRNESPLRGQFYRKRLVQVALEYRL